MTTWTEELLEVLDREKASAILRTEKAEAVVPAMNAAIEGGFEVCELTMTIPGVLDHLDRLRSEHGDAVWLGAGTVLTTEEARAAVEHGARFLVSPVVDEDVIQQALDLGVAMIPGTHTPTEMMRAHRARAPLVKLFPAPGIGPAFVKATLGPLPFLKIVPTSGVDEDNCLEWLEAGAYSVGFVASLFDPGDIERDDYDAIRERASRIIRKIRER